MSVSAALTAFVSGKIRDRGREYYRSGAVHLEAVRPDSVSAWVSGSDDYMVDLAVSGQVVRAECTCPYIDQFGEPCKHIWATILAAEPRGFAAGLPGPLRLMIEGIGDDDDWDDEYDPAPPVNRYAPPPPKPPPPPKWADQLAILRREIDPSAGRTHSPPAERQLLYVVDLPASEQAKKLVLEFNFRERKKNGEWGKPKAQSIAAHNIDSLSEPADRQMLALLAGAEKGDSYGYWTGHSGGYGVNRYKLAGPLLDAVLPTLAGTGRVFLRRESRPPVTLIDLVPELDPPWELTVGVNRDEAGRDWQLNGHLTRGQQTIALTMPDLIVPGLVFWDGKFARLNDGGAFAWVPALRRFGGLSVPKTKADDLIAQLLQMPHLPGLVLPDELRYTEEVVPPRPRVEVTKSKQTFGQPVLNAELSFEYGFEIIPAHSPDRGVYRADERRFLVRDPAAERAAERELDRLGVRVGYSVNNTRIRQLKPSQLPSVVAALVPAGWRVEADGSLYRKPNDFELSVSSGQDWFDIHGHADFDGIAVPFPQLLAALARGDCTVILDDGTVGLIPDDWLTKYGLIGKMGRVEGETVRFSKRKSGCSTP